MQLERPSDLWCFEDIRVEWKRARERKRETETTNHPVQLCTSLLFCSLLCVSLYNANNDVSVLTHMKLTSAESAAPTTQIQIATESCACVCICACLPACLLACACNVYLCIYSISHNWWNNVLHYDYELAGLSACLPASLFAQITVSFQSYVSWHKRRSNKFVHRHTHTRTRKHGNQRKNLTTKTIEAKEPNRKKTAWYSTERKIMKITNTQSNCLYEGKQVTLSQSKQH